jgi:tetratricopeptide (TPR) repeat protein
MLRRRTPYLLVGWLWYLGTLVPVIGLVQVGQQAAADRYTYIPLIGLFIALAWGLADIVERWPQLRKVAVAGAMAAVLASVVFTWLQVRHWKDSIALWGHALQVAADNPVARNNLGLAHLEEKGSAATAEEHLRAAIALRPGYVRAFTNLGMALDRQGKTEEAIGWYRQALEIEPDLPVTRNNLGIALAKRGRLEEAIEQLTEAVRLAPGYSDARRNLERALDARSRARLQ